MAGMAGIGGNRLIVTRNDLSRLGIGVLRSVHMKQLTIRNIDVDLERRLREVANRRDTSLNKAALYLMRRGAGLTALGDQPPAIGNALREFRGTWSETDERLVLDAVADLDRVDGDFWK